MKRPSALSAALFSLTLFTFFNASSAHAGVYATQPQPAYQAPCKYGLGSYWALQGGLNACQTYEGTVRGEVGGQSVAIEVKEKLGGFGGLKFGYNFEGGVMRPAIEFEGFCNGADFTVSGRVNGQEVAKGTGRFDTGAFMVNGLLRFDLGGAFLPCIGAGAGLWIGEVDDARLTVQGAGSATSDDNASGSGLAAQVLAGFDCYLTERTSFFTEDKFLNYFGSDLPTGDAISQHLIGVGMRFGF